MRKFNTHTLGIAQGSIVLFSDYQHDGVMWTGKGAREFRHVVTFDEPFLAPPMVQVGISMFDFDRETNQRADISAELITREGFAIVFRTWNDTRVARIRADWTAFGEVHSEDDWVIE
ncbi:H-type lectin domain protein [Pseudoruegeria aquimaris]|uniref:H-type lectin domain protein n=1 Tax=Pseudoruegeria aquimaris TaxID=393663 RepID=A0A1Y5T9S7_9RHOB|nr:H-type lectin domain-containing protein [Pseudoruegeria aquimaris]SLN57253.1 H-type lectin domain protein [Pseudoruegeria aquimaris]